MKQTELDRRERELRKIQKKEEKGQKHGEAEELSVGGYIAKLSSFFFHDGNKIYNVAKDERILELLLDMKENVPEKQWDNIIRKAVKKTQVKEREPAITELKALAEIGG